jgi:hypothetical protein
MDVIQRAELDRVGAFAAGATRVVVDRGGGAFATARDGGAALRALARVVLVEAAGAGLLASTRADAFAGARTTGLSTERACGRAGAGATSLAEAVTRRGGAGAGVGSAGLASTVGAGSVCTTVPADCIETGALRTTGVGAEGSVSTVARAIAVSW